ncbi:ATP-binding protein [Streptomyces sp. NPDC001941]|uniref:AAA family ATPase n=1 Tax=Streptomyces sp. NPDC001941 TaxID=3154659 RepID=UPI00332A7E26
MRPAVTELRLSAFRSHRRATFPITPVTLFAGASGSGKSTVLRAYEALARLASGAPLESVFDDPVSYVPERAAADAQGRRGFRIGCTADGPLGPVHLDVAIQAEPELRVVGERLTWDGRELLTTALRDPGRSSVQAAWLTGGAAAVTRAPLPDDRLGTALLPLRVAGSTEGQLQVLAAAEQLLVALRSVFACDPQPVRMRRPAAPGDGRLRRGCDNLAEVLLRTRTECATRHAALVRALRDGCSGEVEDLAAHTRDDGTVRALLARPEGRPDTPVERLGDGELRFLALALVVLTGPGVLEVEQASEVPAAIQSLTVVADNLDRGLDRRQSSGLLRLAVMVVERGHVRLTGAVGETGAQCAREVEGVTVVDLEP